MKFQPVIKWSGSKRSQSEEILKHFPKKIRTYYEPFIGGGSVMFQLLNSDIAVERYVCSDKNEDLINLWKAIKCNPEKLIKSYRDMWNELNIDNDLDRQKNYYNSVRERFNKERNEADFLFLSRTAINGLIRYNSKGEFNSSFHLSRKGIAPEKLEKIINQWSGKLNEKNVEFICRSYEEVKVEEEDFIYLDPPYFNTKGMYFGRIEINDFWIWLKKQECRYVLSFDGISGNVDSTYDVPKEIYDQHYYIYNGCSSFKRIKNNDVSYVKESLYVKNK